MLAEGQKSEGPGMEDGRPLYETVTPENLAGRWVATFGTQDQADEATRLLKQSGSVGDTVVGDCPPSPTG